MTEREWLESDDPVAMLEYITLDQFSTGWRLLVAPAGELTPSPDCPHCGAGD